jgi:hypothetical protein
MTARLAVAIVPAIVIGALLAGCGARNGPPPSQGTTRPVTVYATGALPVHATPSADAKVVGRLAPNARVTRTQVDRGWARIEGDKVEGWVDASRLTAEAPAATSPAPPRAE